MRRAFSLVLLTLAGMGCHRRPGDTPKATARVSGTTPEPKGAPSPTSALAPLVGSWLETLPLDDKGLAYVTPPVGAREPRPLIVAIHGAGDRPEWACGGWRLAASEYAFVVCPRGLPMGADRFAWDQPKTIATSVAASIAAVRAHFGAYVADGPVIYAAFSQGATLAERALLDEARAYPRVALAEGGYALLQDGRFLRRLKDHGTERALVVCGSPACFTTARRAESALKRAGLEARVAGDAVAGHNLNQRMQVALRAAWPAFVDGLPNWVGFPRYLEARAH